MITPEQAADVTEAQWLARSGGEAGDWVCGWCEFAQAAGGEPAWGEDLCLPYCPVPVVFGVRCCSVPELESWLNASGQLMCDAALEVYVLAVRMRSELVEAAYGILEEAGDVHTGRG